MPLLSCAMRAAEGKVHPYRHDQGGLFLSRQVTSRTRIVEHRRGVCLALEQRVHR